MPLDRAIVDELKTHLILCKQKRLAFGLCLGKKPEGTLFMLDKKKPPETLGRLAKKDGETQKMACGYCGVEGAKVNLYIDGEPIPGLSRKMKDYFAAAGMKYKVYIFDTSGKALEGDDEDEGGEGQGTEGEGGEGGEADPAQQEWQKVKAELGELVAQSERLPGGDELVKDWQEIVGLADGGDARGALLKAETLRRRIAEAQQAAEMVEADRTRWMDSVAKLGPMVKALEGSSAAAAKKALAVWSFANGKADGTPPDYATAIKSIAPLVKLIQEARAASPEEAEELEEEVEEGAGLSQTLAADGDGTDGTTTTAPSGDGTTTTTTSGSGGQPPQQPQPQAPQQDMSAPGDSQLKEPGKSATDKERLTYADARLIEIDKAIAAYLALIPDVAETAPALWTNARSSVDGVLAPMRGDAGTVDAKKLGDGIKALEKLAAAIKTATGEKQEWKKTRDMILLRLVPLDRHGKAAHAAVAPKIAAVRAELVKAENAAKVQDFKKAQSTAKPLPVLCDKIEVLEDNVAHYDSIFADRQTSVTGLGAATGDKEIDKVLAAAQKLLADAQGLATKEKFAEAIKKLDQIPALVDSHVRLKNQATSYTNRLTSLQNWEANLPGTYTADVLKLLKADIDTAKKRLKAAEIGTTKSYATSVRLLGELAGRRTYIDQTLKVAKEYSDAKTAFDPKFDLFKKHKGLSGIREWFDAMERDKDQAETEAKAGKFGTAAALLKRTAGEWAAQETQADKCEVYLTKRKDVEKQMADLKKKPPAADAVAQAAALLASALRQSQAFKFDDAKATLDEAETRLTDAQTAIDAKKDLDDAGDKKAIGNIKKDLDKAIQVYDDKRAVVAGKDTGNLFTAKLGEADTEAQKARDQKTATPPDLTAARSALETAIGKLEALLPKVVAAGPFATHLADAKNEQSGMTDPDNMLTPQITRVNTLITDAENLGKAPDFDFGSAEAKLVQAREGAKKAKDDAALWPTIKADRARIDTRETNINSAGAPVTGWMAPTLTKLAEHKQGINDALAAEDFVEAARLAKLARAAAARVDKDLALANTMVTKFANSYTNRLASIQGANQTRSPTANALLASRKQQYDDALAAGNYQSANLMIDIMGWAIDAAKRVQDEYALYEPSRVIAENKLNTLRGNRNAGVEEEVKALEKRYTDGVALSTAETNLPAKKVMDEIAPLIDALNTKALAWKAFDDSRTAARAKIEALDNHDQAASVKPMADALRGNFAAGEAAAEKGDLAGAKAIMDKIPAEADKALVTANAAKAVIDKAGDVGDAAMDPGLLAQAKKVYDGLNGRTDADNARGELNVAKGHLDGATSATDPAKAKTMIKAAMEACTLAQARLAQHEMLEASLKEVETLVTALKSHAQSGYLTDEVKAVEAEIKSVRDDAKAKGPDGQGGRVQKLNETCAELKVLADKQAEYLALLATPEVQPRLEQLERHDHRYAVKPSIDAFRKKLDAADKASKAKKPEDAIKLLQEGSAIANSAWVMAEMRANTPPTVDQVKKILAGPGGPEELDAMIEQLEPEAQRKVIRVAFEARFGCKIDNFTGTDANGNPTGLVADGNLKGPNMKRFYDLMSKLPKDHVVDNDSMRKLVNIQDTKGSSFSPGKKEVVMREGDEVISPAYRFGVDHEVGGADKDCQPANNDEVKFFSWNTLHEVGHAVDDKLGFMDKNGNGAAYGGWTMHDTDTQTIANAVSRHFKYDATYIGQLLSNASNPPIPPIPSTETCTPEEWDQRRLEAVAWVASARTGNSPWAANSTAKKIALSGKVYQESYNFRWSSYNLDARKQGMTGYQFRAPGEWFAELYAAYHSDKLKPSHPAVKWLSTL